MFTIKNTEVEKRFCPHCGRELLPLIYEIDGLKVPYAWSICDCDEAQQEQAEREKREQAEREKREQDQIISRLANAGLRPRYMHATHDKAQSLTNEILKGKNLYLWGNVGTGKTTCAAAIMINIVKRGKYCAFWRMHDVLDASRKSFKEDDGTLDKLTHTKFLVIDDIGKEQPTPYALERIFALIDERNACMLPTIVTTQYKPSDLAQKLAAQGDIDTAQAIVSRLTQDCVRVEFTGKDARLG